MSCEFFKLAETRASNRKLLRAALYKNIRLKGISKEFNFTTKYHERRSCNKVVTTHQELHLGLLCYWVMYWKHLSFIAYLHFFVYFRWRSWLDRYQIDSYFNVILVEDLRGDNPIGRLMIGDNNGDICLFITFFPWDDWWCLLLGFNFVENSPNNCFSLPLFWKQKLKQNGDISLRKPDYVVL